MKNAPEPDNSADDKPTSPFIEAFRTISHVTTAVALMLICGGIGYAIDHWLEITFFALLGFGGGAVLGIQYLIRMTSDR